MKDKARHQIIDLRHLIETLESKESCVHILINNAGIFSARQVSAGVGGEEVRSNLFEPDNASFEDWLDVYRTNCASHYFSTTAFLPLLDRASEASPGYTSTVINISSINGLIKESLDHFASNAAKAATIHLTKMLANETAKLGLRIRVNSIAPGVFPSEITAGGSNDSQKSVLGDDQFPLTKTISAGRPGNDMVSSLFKSHACCNLGGRTSQSCCSTCASTSTRRRNRLKVRSKIAELMALSGHGQRDTLCRHEPIHQRSNHQR